MSEKKSEKKVVDQKKDMVYTISLGRLYWGRRSNRSNRAIKYIRKFVIRHFHVDEVLIDPLVNQFIWSRSREKPPRRITIRVIRIRDNVARVVLASPAS